MEDERDAEVPAFRRHIPRAHALRNGIVEAAVDRELVADGHGEIGPDHGAGAARESTPNPSFAAVAEVMAVVEGVEIDRLVAGRHESRFVDDRNEFLIAHADRIPKSNLVAIEYI